VGDLQDTLVRRRHELVAYDEAVHSAANHGTYRSTTSCAARWDTRDIQIFHPVDVDVLTGPVYGQARHDLREYANKGALICRGELSVAGALLAGSIATTAQAEAALRAASTSRGTRGLRPRPGSAVGRGVRPASSDRRGRLAALFDLLKSIAPPGALRCRRFVQPAAGRACHGHGAGGPQPGGPRRRGHRQRPYKAARKHSEPFAGPGLSRTSGVA